MNNSTLECEFFRLFAEFEYALKKSGFFMPNREEAKANWDKFSSVIQDAFDKETKQELAEAIDDFLHCPPKKQFIKNGSLKWERFVIDSGS